MNIFVLDLDPVIAAQSHCDRHVGKLLLESVQMLSTVARQHGQPAPYRSTHAAHPCTAWVASSQANWDWLVQLACGLDKEYTLRYGKQHASGLALRQVLVPPASLPYAGLTAHVQAMPEQYRVRGAPVSAYRRYYQAEKRNFARWARGRAAPTWWSKE